MVLIQGKTARQFTLTNIGWLWGWPFRKCIYFLTIIKSHKVKSNSFDSLYMRRFSFSFGLLKIAPDLFYFRNAFHLSHTCKIIFKTFKFYYIRRIFSKHRSKDSPRLNISFYSIWKNYPLDRKSRIKETRSWFKASVLLSTAKESQKRRQESPFPQKTADHKNHFTNYRGWKQLPWALYLCIKKWCHINIQNPCYFPDPKR